MSRYYLLMIFGFLFLIFPLLTGSFPIEPEMGQDTNQEALTYKGTSTWSRMPEADDVVHAHRLYEGYLDLLKFRDGEVQRKAKMASPSQNKKQIGPISALLMKSDKKGKGSVNPPIIKYDATDDRSEARSQYMARRPLKKKEKMKVMEKVNESFDDSGKIQLKEKENSEGKALEENNKIDLKNFKEKGAEKTFSEGKDIRLNKFKEKPQAKAFGVIPMTVPIWNKPIKGFKATHSNKPLPKDAKMQRMNDLSRIYNEYLKAWELPYPNNMLETSTPGRTFNFSGIQLSALNDLINVLEHFQQGNLVNDLAKKISMEMEPNLQKQISQDAHLVSESRASLRGIIKNDLSGLFGNMKPTNASTAFRDILDDIKSRRSQIKAGQLYDEYKKGFCKILSEQKHPRQSDIEKASNNAKNQKVSDPELEAYNKNKSYLKVIQAFIKMNEEKKRNGGLNPYYIPMAKTRQLVHNDIPLIKPGSYEAPKKLFNQETCFPEREKEKDKEMEKEKEKEKYVEHKTLDCFEPDTTTTKKPAQNAGTKEPFICPWKDWHSGIDSKYTNKDFPKQETTNLKKPVQKFDPKEPFIINSKDVYSDIYAKHVSEGIKAIKNASFLNLLEEYQKQVQSLSEALKNKQNWWKEAKDECPPCPKALKRNIHANKPPVSRTPKRNARVNNLGTMPFPEVLVNQAPQVPTNVLGNMASQLNVSPIEMARRIVGVGQAPPAVYSRVTVPQIQSGKLVDFLILFNS
ncbi:hypothetical protein KR038_011290 [Drosophila bunnanda]|nr:hypothetical protein KR038_011290 [Drosophila bunnanda]